MFVNNEKIFLKKKKNEPMETSLSVPVNMLNDVVFITSCYVGNLAIYANPVIRVAHSLGQGV